MPIAEITSELTTLTKLIQAAMHDAAWKDFHAQLKVVSTLDELKKRHGIHAGISIIGWCGNMDCITHLEEVSDHDVLGNPLTWNTDNKESLPENCITCGKPKKEILAVGRAY